MAHSLPTAVLNKGDAWRVTTAGGRFIIELCGDRRVRAGYADWWDRGKRALDRALQRARETDEAALKAWIDGFTALSAVATERFVRDELRLSYTWVAPCLDECFRHWVHNENHPDEERLFSLHVFLPKLAPIPAEARAERSATSQCGARRRAERLLVLPTPREEPSRQIRRRPGRVRGRGQARC